MALGGRELPRWFSGVIALTAPALLTALVVTSVFADEDEWAVGPETAGVVVAGAILWRGGSVLPAVLIAAAVTAVLRAAF